MQNIMVVTEKNRFIARAMAEQLKELEYNVFSTELDVQLLAKLNDTYEAIVLYIEGDIEEKTQELVYLRDRAVEEELPVFYIGENVSALQSIIPAHMLKEVFQRPIDVKIVSKEIDKYIKNHGKHMKKKILVVDDSGAMLRNVKGWLEDKYHVILANSGAMAIKYLATDRPDLVLLDYEMPVVDGSQVLEMIRTEMEFSDIPVIFLTSKNDKASIMKVMALKPEGYILKSTDPELIKQEIDEFFEKRKF